ncbi:hypothetical protein YC2023_088170 [Brassica napus]
MDYQLILLLGTEMMPIKTGFRSRLRVQTEIKPKSGLHSIHVKKINPIKDVNAILQANKLKTSSPHVRVVEYEKAMQRNRKSLIDNVAKPEASQTMTHQALSLWPNNLTNIIVRQLRVSQICQ